MRDTEDLQPIYADLESALTEHLGRRFSKALAIRSQFLAHEGHQSQVPPWGVAQAASADEVQRIHALCHQLGVPIIPFGAGSSVEGQLAATPRSLVLDLRSLNEIISVDAQSMTAKVQCGVTRLQLDAALKGTGLFFPVDPGADATLGGMAATRASGTNAVRYGTMRENTLALEVVLATGEKISCGSAAAKGRQRLRPAASVRRIGRHAGHHHRTDGAPVSEAGTGGWRSVQLPGPPVCSLCRDGLQAGGRSDRAR